MTVPCDPAFPTCLQVYMSEVALYTDYKLDESYTPARVSIRVGNTFSDLREVSSAWESAVHINHCCLQPWRVPPDCFPRTFEHVGTRMQCCDHHMPTCAHPLITFFAAMHCCPLQVRCIDLQEPQGWVVVPLPPEDNPE